MKLFKFKNLITPTLLLLALLMTNIIEAQKNEMPPIIDRDIFFGDPEISGAQLSPDGKYMTFMKPYEGVRNIWLKKLNDDFKNARPITADKERPIPGYFWSHDSKFILYVQDKGGDENYHVHAVNLGHVKDGKDGMPKVRNITEGEEMRALIFSVPKSDPDAILVGMNDRDKAWHDLYKVKISTGERTLIKKNTERITGWEFDNNDELRMASRRNDDGTTEILNITDKGFEVCYTCNIKENCGVYRFHKDNDKAYFITNKGDDVDLSQLVLLDPKTGKTEFVESDPEKQVDFGGASFSDLSNEMIATSYTGDKTRRYFKDAAYEADYNFLKSKFPGAEVGWGSSTKDEQKFIIYVNSDTDPGATYLFDRKTKKIDFQYRPRPNLPVEHLAKMEPVRYKSMDGLEIPAYLTLPKGKEAKNLPVILFIHGGPWARDYWGFNSYAQFWANRGYAVLQPNFRSSTGYGKSFLNAGNKEWGNKMQDDITAGAYYLIEKGIADPSKIAIMGGSYGGYATLAGLTFTPDVYAAGISIVGPSNLLTLLETIPPYWESFRKVFHERMGDPATPEGKAKLMAQSPLNSADKIKVPLMVVQGANDPRVKQAESDQIVIAMRELGLPVEYLVAKDEGHGFANKENRLAYIAASEKFFAKHIGGRYQESVPENIAKKLDDLTVDINTVKLTEIASDEEANAPLPIPEHMPKASVCNYGVTIEMGPQKIPMDMKRVVQVDGDKIVVSDESSSAMGSMSDKTTMNIKDLSPIKREISQGPVTIVLDHSTDQITGNMSMNGQEKTFSQKLDAPVFGDGGALDLTLAALPLKVGYETMYRTFDPQAQKVKLFKLAVKAMEQVDVPAGKYNTYKVEVKPGDGEPGGSTLWIATEEKQVIKSSTIVPQMGGAKVTAELKSME